MQSLDSDGSAESDAVLEEAFATAEGIVEPVEGDEAEARLPPRWLLSPESGPRAEFQGPAACKALCIVASEARLDFSATTQGILGAC